MTSPTLATTAAKATAPSASAGLSAFIAWTSSDAVGDGPSPGGLGLAGHHPLEDALFGAFYAPDREAQLSKDGRAVA